MARAEPPAGGRVSWNLPNVITTGRLLLTPLLVWLLLQPSGLLRGVAFVVFLVAAVSDLWDGHLARARSEITDYGKLLDPLADKLLLVAALVPLHLLTERSSALAGLPLYGVVPLWAVLVLLGREALITLLRTLSARAGRVVAASRAGKIKAFTQNLFLGSGILWVAVRTPGVPGEEAGWPVRAWFAFHGWFVATALSVALLLTVYSMARYLAFFHRTRAEEGV